MGRYATAARRVIDQAFDASSGDMQGDVEPAFISERGVGSKQGKDVATCKVREQGDTLEVSYRLLDASLDDADFARIFHIAYLDVFTSHYWYNETSGKFAGTKLKLVNEVSGAVTTVPYPDPE